MRSATVGLDIVGVGMATIDRLYLLEDPSRLPEGRLLQYSVQGGGQAATAMAAASRLGALCGMIAAVGDDEPGRDILCGLASCGVDTSRCLLRPGMPSPVVLVIVDARTGARHFLPYHADRPLVSAEDVDWHYAAGARILHLDNWVVDLEAALRRARQLGPQVMVDANVVTGLEPSWLALVDVFIGSADVRTRRTDSDAALREAVRIRALGPHTAVLTLGADGCVGAGPEGPFRVPGFAVQVVDTTGAGDVFHGAYAYGLLRGWAAGDCARFACAAAALSTTRLGGRAGLPTSAQVAAFLHSRAEAGPWDS